MRSTLIPSIKLFLFTWSTNNDTITPSKTVDHDKVAKELEFEYKSCFIKQIEL